MAREELAWAAGFFDGEGHIGIVEKRTNGNIHYSVIMSIGNTHEPHLHRFKAAVLELGVIEFKKGTNPNWKPQWTWRIHSFEEVQAVVALLWFKLGEEKKGQAEAILLQLQEYRKTISPRRARLAHGTVTMYRKKACRCNECEAAYKQSNRDRYTPRFLKGF